ncbi:hypothetical protein Goari_000845 [Gossypium aridum]|uniref:Uncharacterized protein n=1 Tax=Gossypium aridum TaxID=34290 RepID=A0A7J8YHX3_GOSAI|nr:hypothetical protein [Gossypium aridum]
MHQMIGGRVVPEAQKFRNSDINLEFEGKLDQMFMGIVTTSDKAWTLFQVHSLVNFLKMLTLTCLKRIRNKMKKSLK